MDVRTTTTLASVLHHDGGARRYGRADREIPLLLNETETKGTTQNQYRIE
jgi:hypothetical protein